MCDKTVSVSAIPTVATTMAVRRNRRKERPVSDHAVVALHKYYLRAELMRAQYYHAVDMLKAKYGLTEWMKDKPTNEHFNARMYLDYWWAALCIVVEGYEKLSLYDADVEKLLESPFTPKLRSYRSGTYHFSEKYFDLDKLALANTAGGAEWATKLDMALGHFLLRHLREIRTRRERRGDVDKGERDGEHLT